MYKFENIRYYKIKIKRILKTLYNVNVFKAVL